jgi:hypothetical protein
MTGIYWPAINVTFFNKFMHTCTCNDDNNLCTHEVSFSQSVGIYKSMFDYESMKKLDQSDSQVIIYLCDNTVSLHTITF